MMLIAKLEGPQLIWARAAFNLNTVQINQYNKLDLEIYSKNKEPIKIKKIQIRFNEPSLNQDLTQDFSISKDEPIKIQRELYISKDNQ